MSGIERLGNLLNRQTQRVMEGNQSLAVSLGSVNGDLSITIDGIGGNVPKGQYMVSRSLTLEEIVTTTVAEGHTHDVESGLRPLKSGDRVLVIWAGSEPVVADIIVSS